MDLPTLLLNHKLANGQILAAFVGGNAPSRLPLNDMKSFTEIWRNRLADAKSLNRKDLEAKANSILLFLSKNSDDVSLLLWPKYRISVLFTEHSEAFLVLDETTSS